ncbi:MAG: hypothetical protein GY928_15760 [Colwellia sp.]|nr:hypothetical protein [Colwellia sp.]
MVEHQVDLVHHYCGTFYATQQANINSQTVQQNKEQLHGWFPPYFHHQIGQNIAAGQTRDTTSVVKPSQTNTHKITSISLENGEETALLTPRESNQPKQLCFFFFVHKDKTILKLFKVNHHMVAAVTIDINVIILYWLCVFDWLSK